MLPIDALKRQLKQQLKTRRRQGQDVERFFVDLQRLPDSYDAIWAFARLLDSAPQRDDWPYHEPVKRDEIMAACHPRRPLEPMGALDPDEVGERVRAAFLARVCGCILGKPLEINPTLAQLKDALTPIGAWPLRGYVPEAADPEIRRVTGKRGLHRSWGETVQERIRYVAPDDDINYTLIAMLALEKHGVGFQRADLTEIWLDHLPVGATFGPERRFLVNAAQRSIHRGGQPDFYEWVSLINPTDEKCGAMIRVDAYGYACAGHPALAAELAWRDAGLTHRKTGVYGAMFAAAAVACAFVATEPQEIFETALMFVPQNSRFHEIASDCLRVVLESSDWLSAYDAIHARYGGYGHCWIYQETGFLMNALRFATDVGDGICKAVSQGADTDCFGATAGSLLGAYFGPGHLEPRWIEPFNDELRTSLARFPERSLNAVADRMARLPLHARSMSPKG